MAMKNKNTRRLTGIERLQARDMMAADVGEAFNFISSYPNDNGNIEIRVSGTDSSDSVTVTETGSETSNLQDDMVNIRQVSGGNVQTRSYLKHRSDGTRVISKIIFNGEGGNDFFRNNTDVPAEANAGVVTITCVAVHALTN